MGVQLFLQIRCPYGVALGNRDVGGYPLYGTGPGRFPRTGGAATGGQIPWCRSTVWWKYTSADAAREEVGFKPMESYIRKMKNTATQYIDTRPILYLGEETDSNQG